MNGSVLTFTTIEDYLGPAETRFFGAGYRRARYDYSPLTFDGSSVTGVLGVEYPTDWSRKKVGSDLRPHLSTVDTMLVGAQLADALLCLARGLDDDARARSRITGLVLQAGTRPEEDLDAIPLSASIKRSVAGPGDGETTTTVIASVGAMRVRCQVVHPDRPQTDVRRTTLTLEDVLGAGHSRLWGDGYRRRQQNITGVTADVGALTALAVLDVTGRDGSTPHGIEAEESPFPGLVDVFVSSLQLAQVLLYEMDGVSRAESATLWMQQTTLTRDESPPERSEPAPIGVHVTSAELLTVHGATWRNIQFTARSAGITQRSTFAHRLP